MYFKYSRKTGQDYIRFLLDEHFTPKRVNKKIERDVTLQVAEEMRVDTELEDVEEESEEPQTAPVGQLAPTDIRDFVNSLKESAVHWFNSFYADLATGMSGDEQQRIACLNRIGIGYFRPLIMAILKNEQSEVERIASFGTSSASSSSRFA